MRYSFLFVFFILSTAHAAVAQKLTIGQWYTHLPHRSARQVVDTGEEVFALTDVYYFSFEKNTGVIERYDKVWGLNDVQVDHLAYSTQQKALIVVYRNTNIDLIKNGNTVINVSDIFRKSISGIKEINEVVIKDSLAYFATTFGLVVFDIEREEFRDTYIIGDNGSQVSVLDVVFTTDSIFALTAQGLKKGPLQGSNLANYQNWENIGTANGMPVANGQQLEMVGDTIFALFADTVYQGYNGVWSSYYADTNYTLKAIKTTNNRLLILETNTALQGRISYKEGATWQVIAPANLNIPADVTWDQNNVLWVADEFQGLLRITNATNVDRIVPNGPSSLTITDMSYKDGAMWVAPGGATQSWGYSFNDKGFFYLEDGFWSEYNQYNIPGLENILNIFTIATSPKNNKIYLGSFWDGVLIWDGDTLIKYNKDNSTLEGATGDELRTRISSLALDDNENLWIANHGSPSPFHVLTPEGTMVRLPIPLISLGSVADIVIDDFNRKWVALPQSSSQGILVYDHGTDVVSTADDQYKILTNQTGNGSLPNNEVLALANDKSGQIWVGTSQGIGIFYCPGSIFSQGCDAQRIIVSRGGFNGYLLENERINDILVDGADRKWVGTTNGLWVFSPDGTQELAYYTEENSPLISDNIRKISYDGEHGIVYISTDKGLMALRTEATEATNTYIDPIEVFPNPVKETYGGPIAIRGLPNNAEVRITDVTGMMIYQTQAFGGQAVWDGRDYTGRKAKTGVYLVFSVNEDGSESKPTKLLLIK